MDFKSINKATLRLFKSVYTEDGSTISISEKDMISLASKGIMFAPDIKFTDKSNVLEAVNSAEEIYGVNLVELSNTFHKTWKTVEEIDPTIHYLQQILHYLTTYGFDALGIDYEAGNAYIPEEKIPYEDGVKPFNFIILKAITNQGIMEKLNTLLTSGVALSQQQVDDVVCLLDFMASNNVYYDFTAINNKEVKTIIWLKMAKKPYIPVDEFLRALTYEVRKSTLLVRSYRDHKMNKLYMKYDKKLRTRVASLLEQYINDFGIDNIASQFLRNKMLFLSFKCDETKSLINKIRREADKYHKPQTESHLVAEDIPNANIWQLVKYYNLCLSNLNPTKDKLYQIRNGKNYLTENPNYNISGEPKRIITEHYEYFKKLIEEEFINRLSSLKDKVLIIPDYIDYKVPSSLKRLSSGVPEGSVMTFPEDRKLTVGIHWTNKLNSKKHEIRTDLDLHANSINKSIGWYTSYRNGDILFSGDVTDAPIAKGGASEAITFNKIKEPYIVTLNDYTQYGDIPFKFVFDLDLIYEVDSNKRKSEARGYIFSPNARVLNAKTDKSQHSLGLITGNKFYFLNSDIFEGPVTHNDDLLKRLLTYYNDSQANQLNIRKLANIVGIQVVSKVDDVPKIEVEHEDSETTLERMPFIDLSLEAITEDTFPQMFNIQ